MPFIPQASLWGFWHGLLNVAVYRYKEAECDYWRIKPADGDDSYEPIAPDDLSIWQDSINKCLKQAVVGVRLTNKMLNEPANSLAIDWGSTQLEVGLRCYGENPPNPHMEIIADEIASKYLGEMPDRIILHVKNRIIGLRCGTITHVGGLRWDDPDTGITYILIADLSTAGYPRTHRHEIYHSFGSGGDYISDIGGRGQNDENIMYFKATQDAGAHIGIYPRQEVSTGNGDPITDQLERQWHKTERE